MIDRQTLEQMVRDLEELKRGQQSLAISKPLFTMINWKTEVQIAADQSNYDPENYDAIIIEPTGANRTIHGFQRGVPGRVLHVMNSSNTLSLLFTHQNAAADADNRLSTTTLLTITLQPRRWTTFLYVDDATIITGATRWIMMYPPS